MSGEKNRPSFRPKRAIKSPQKGLPPKKLTITKGSSPPLAAAAKQEVKEEVKPEPKTEKPPCVIEIGDKPTSSERKAKRRDGRACARGRLPEGSSWQFMSNTSKQTVSGVLLIPSSDGVGFIQRFENEAPGLFQCAEELDLMYRKWLKEKEKEEKAKEKTNEKPDGVQLPSL